MVDRTKPALFGVDRATVFTPSDLPKLRDVVGGIDWVAVYIGGPRSAGRGWTRDAVQTLANVQPGLGFLPIYVGRNAPWDTVYNSQAGHTDAARAIELCDGFNLATPEGPLCLDVEHATWDANAPGMRDYVLAWCDTVADYGFTPVVYGPTGLCAWLQAARSQTVKTWAAYWPHSGDTWVRLQGAARPMLNLTLGGMRTPDAWQFVGDAPIIGGVDASVSRPDFPLCELAPNDDPIPLPEPTEPTNGDDMTGYPPYSELRAEIDSLAGSVSELYAHIGVLEEAVGKAGVSLAPTAPAEPEELFVVELAPNELRAWQHDTLPVIAQRYGHAGDWQPLVELNEFLPLNDAIPEGTIVTVPLSWVSRSIVDVVTDEVDERDRPF